MKKLRQKSKRAIETIKLAIAAMVISFVFLAISVGIYNLIQLINTK